MVWLIVVVYQFRRLEVCGQMVKGWVKLLKTSVLFEVGETVEYAIVAEIEVGETVECAIVVEIEVEVWM